MSHSDRVSTRPWCFGRFAREYSGDRICYSCDSNIYCIPQQDGEVFILTAHGPLPSNKNDAACMEIPYQGGPDKEALRNMPVSLSKYHREITKPAVVDGRDVVVTISIDVYDVLHAWRVSNPALSHLLKKCLQPGERGHKTLVQDLDDIVASAIRARELEQ